MKAEMLLKIQDLVKIPQFVVLKSVEDNIPFTCEYYAVRSSAVDEDGSQESKAGFYTSFLFVKKEDLSEKIDFVLKESGIVIVQEMINSDFSGVILSNKETRVFLAKGLCEGITSGKVMTDEYLIEKNEFKKIDSLFGDNLGAFYKEGVIVIEECDELILSENEQKQINNLIEILKKEFSYSLDIEFTFKDGKLYCLQCREFLS